MPGLGSPAIDYHPICGEWVTILQVVLYCSLGSKRLAPPPFPFLFSPQFPRDQNSTHVALRRLFILQRPELSAAAIISHIQRTLCTTSEKQREKRLDECFHNYFPAFNDRIPWVPDWEVFGGRVGDGVLSISDMYSLYFTLFLQLFYEKDARETITVISFLFSFSLSFSCLNFIQNQLIQIFSLKTVFPRVFPTCSTSQIQISRNWKKYPHLFVYSLESCHSPTSCLCIDAETRDENWASVR